MCWNFVSINRKKLPPASLIDEITINHEMTLERLPQFAIQSRHESY